MTRRKVAGIHGAIPTTSQRGLSARFREVSVATYGPAIITGCPYHQVKRW